MEGTQGVSQIFDLELKGLEQVLNTHLLTLHRARLKLAREMSVENAVELAETARTLPEAFEGRINPEAVEWVHAWVRSTRFWSAAASNGGWVRGTSRNERAARLRASLEAREKSIESAICAYRAATYFAAAIGLTGRRIRQETDAERPLWQRA